MWSLLVASAAAAGGDVDAHGCKTSAGQEWCPSTEKCVRPFEAVKCPGGTVGCRDFCGKNPDGSYGTFCTCAGTEVRSEGNVDVSKPAERTHKCYRPDLGPKPPAPVAPLPHTYTPEGSIPTSFDWRDVAGTNYLTPNLNQHIPTYCGSCWLHGSISVMMDRIKIKRNAQWPEVILARQVVLNCGQEMAGSCQGGSDLGLYQFAKVHGIPDETCQQYEAVDYNCSAKRTCMNCDPPQDGGQCYPVQRYTKYFAEEYGSLPNATVHQIQAEVFRRGPITCSIDASLIEKTNYQRGQVVSATSRPDGKPWEQDHIVSIVGWGEEDGVQYWQVRNSWGSFWGEAGFFRVAAGKNVMAIESSCNWVVPQWPPVVDDFGPSDITHDFPSDPGHTTLV